MKESTARKLEDFMQKYSLSLNDLVELTGLSKGTLSNAKNGNMSLKTYSILNSCMDDYIKEQEGRFLDSYFNDEEEYENNSYSISEYLESYDTDFNINYGRFKLNKVLDPSQIKRKTYTYNGIPLTKKDRKMIKNMLEFIHTYLDNKYNNHNYDIFKEP